MGYSPWLFWDGRKDSLWSPALGPLENPVEQGTDRTSVLRVVAEHHGVTYMKVFGSLPDLQDLNAQAFPEGDPDTVAAWEAMEGNQQDAVNRAFANVGKAIAAFERTILPAESRFDRYVAALSSGEGEAEGVMTDQEREGLRVFIGKGSCINCHALLVRDDPINCLSAYSDAAPEECAELRFMTDEGHELERAFKAPSLRNVAARAPYMHAGQIATLAEVVAHYKEAPEAPAGHSELKPLKLTGDEIAALEAFLRTLDEVRPSGGDKLARAMPETENR